MPPWALLVEVSVRPFFGYEVDPGELRHFQGVTQAGQAGADYQNV